MSILEALQSDAGIAVALISILTYLMFSDLFRQLVEGLTTAQKWIWIGIGGILLLIAYISGDAIDDRGQSAAPLLGFLFLLNSPKFWKFAISFVIGMTALDLLGIYTWDSFITLIMDTVGDAIVNIIDWLRAQLSPVNITPTVGKYSVSTSAIVG